MDLALNNLQRLICHKTKPTNQPKRCIIAELEFEVTYYDVTVKYVSNHTTGTPPPPSQHKITYTNVYN